MSSSKRRKSLFKSTLKRKEICCNGVEDSFECTYKFDVHAGDEKDLLAVATCNESSNFTPYLFSRIRQRIPSHIVGALLTVAVQWDIPHPSIDCRSVHLDMHYAHFYLPPKNMQNSLTNKLSLTLHDLGVLCPDDNQSITRRLVENAIPICCNRTPTNDPSKPRWVSLIVKIAIERVRRANHESGFMEDYYLWGVRDAKRFATGLSLMTRNEILRPEEEVCCPICLRKFEVDCEAAKMPTCPHVYHPSCIMEWIIKKQPSCPLCRATLHNRRDNWRAGEYLLFLE